MGHVQNPPDQNPPNQIREPLTGLQHGQKMSENQEKSWKTKKNDKSQESQVKMGFF